jgi:hypothetical protein
MELNKQFYIIIIPNGKYKGYYRTILKGQGVGQVDFWVHSITPSLKYMPKNCPKIVIKDNDVKVENHYSSIYERDVQHITIFDKEKIIKYEDYIRDMTNEKIFKKED